jgi:1-acyl-sn-glycerol-3-phosphate acyltransferase
MNESMNDCALPPTEIRYAQIVKGRRNPIFAILAEAIREDRHFLMPLALRATLRMAFWIPYSRMIKTRTTRERYVFGVLRFWARRICRICQMRLRVVGKDRIPFDRTCLFVVNHKSPVDIPALYAALPVKAAFVANCLFSQIPIFSYWMRLSGAVFVEQGNPKEELSAFRAMLSRLKAGRSLILFPEGYIHQGRNLAEFKRGGIHAAVLARVPVVPVCLMGTDEVIRTGTLRISPHREVTVEFGAAIEVDGLNREQQKNIDEILYDRITTMRETHVPLAV